MPRVDGPPATVSTRLMAARAPTATETLENTLAVTSPEVPRSPCTRPADWTVAIAFASIVSLVPEMDESPTVSRAPNSANPQSPAPARLTVALTAPEPEKDVPAAVFPTAEDPSTERPYPMAGFEWDELAKSTWIRVAPGVGLASDQNETASAIPGPAVDLWATLRVRVAPAVLPSLTLDPSIAVEPVLNSATPTTSSVSLVPTVCAQENVETAVALSAELIDPVLIGTSCSRPSEGHRTGRRPPGQPGAHESPGGKSCTPFQPG